jgi:hypothetical protein
MLTRTSTVLVVVLIVAMAIMLKKHCLRYVHCATLHIVFCYVTDGGCYTKGV